MWIRRGLTPSPGIPGVQASPRTRTSPRLVLGGREAATVPAPEEVPRSPGKPGPGQPARPRATDLPFGFGTRPRIRPPPTYVARGASYVCELAFDSPLVCVLLNFSFSTSKI